MFRSTNETMNVWTHLLGALLFIFLIYLTYAIPIENTQTMRQDVAKTNAAVLCAGSPEFMSTLFDEEHSKAACVERLRRRSFLPCTTTSLPDLGRTCG